MRYLILSACFILFSCVYTQGQSALKSAQNYMEQGNYVKAINAFNAVRDIQSDADLLAQRGICYYNVNELSKAASDITKSFELGNDDVDLVFLMGKINHSASDYRDAIYFYKQYLKEAKLDDSTKKETIARIEKCFNGIKYGYGGYELGLVESAGKGINTKFDEINPVPSPSSPTKFYFSSNRKSNHDIYGAQIEKGSWEMIPGFSSKLNTGEDDIIQDCNIDGSVLLFLRGKDRSKKRKVLINRFKKTKGNEHYLASRLKAARGDKDVHLISDEIMIFSSNAAGGYGGYDLYISKHTSKGWSVPVNMGSEVNSNYDERSPFLTEDGKTLFFSSNRMESIGGFDIFKIEKKSGTWSPVLNLNSPVNSPEDELYFKIQADGSQAMFASDRKTGFGGFDIYQVYLKEQVKVHTTDRTEIIAGTFKEDEESKNEIGSVINDQSTEKKEVLASTASIDPNESMGSSTSANQTDKKETSREIVKDSQKEDSTTKANVEKKEEDIATIDVKKDIAKKEKQVDDKKVKDNSERKVDVKKSTSIVKDSKKKETEKPSKEKKSESTTKEVAKSSSKKKKEQKSSEEIEVSPLFYTDDESILSDKNKVILDKVILALNRFPQSKVIFTCHSLPEGLPEFEMMFTIRRVDLVSDYLISNSIESERIHINTVGSSYPLIKKVADKEIYNEQKTKNNRIEIRIINSEEEIITQRPEIDKGLMDNSYGIYNTIIEDDAYFRVKIKESESDMFKNAVLRYYNDVFLEKNKKSNTYNYYVGLYPDFKRIFELKTKVQDKYPDKAEIVAFYNGVIITEGEAKLLKGEFPELQNYLDLLDDKYDPGSLEGSQE